MGLGDERKGNFIERYKGEKRRTDLHCMKYPGLLTLTDSGEMYKTTADILRQIECSCNSETKGVQTTDEQKGKIYEFVRHSK